MITYKYNIEGGILETTLTGDVSIADITDYIIKLSKDQNLPNKLKILSDARNANITIGVSPKDLKKIVVANKKSLAQRDFICDAYVVLGKVEAALGFIYKTISKSKNYHFNVFSTKEAAINWLNKF
jgi:hypothetical protein